jgi:ATP-dependent RNA helicase DHX29
VLDSALRIKILRVKLGSTIAEALASALDPPAPLNVMRAVNSLVEVGALTSSDESITPLGRLLSRLPVDVHLGEKGVIRLTLAHGSSN